MNRLDVLHIGVPRSSSTVSYRCSIHSREPNEAIGNKLPRFHIPPDAQASKCLTVPRGDKLMAAEYNMQTPQAVYLRRRQVMVNVYE